MTQFTHPTDAVALERRALDEADSPFHAGERAAQRLAGVRAESERLGRRMIRDHLPEQHRAFYAQLPFVVVGAVDARGRPWASLLTGAPGFARSPDPGRLVLATTPAPGDPLAGALVDGAELGVLGIELHTRRRNRATGRVQLTDEGIELSIRHSFGNCPQYIHPRVLRPEPNNSNIRVGGTCPVVSGLTDSMRSMIRLADTFFIASIAPAEPGRGDDPRRSADASHRGGPAGFVQVDGDVLEFPDYSGNGAFNTIGNLLLEPRAGLVFVDFASGDLLHLTGRAEVIWSGEAIRRHPDAQRVVRFVVDEALLRPAGLPLRLADPAHQGWRPFLVEATGMESETIRSFYLVPTDGGLAEPHAPGQHLTIRLPSLGETPGWSADGPMRSYSLSQPFDGRGYRISVKREPHGQVSRRLHDHIQPGDVLAVRAPAGDFALDRASERPVVLLSAGVGITPLLPMLATLAHGDRPVVFVHGARDGASHAFGRVVRRLSASSAHVVSHIRYSQPRPGDRLGVDFDSVGRMDRALLAELGVDGGFEAYLCGPAGFMAAAHTALRGLGLPDDRIYSEDFGPRARGGSAPARRGDR